MLLKDLMPLGVQEHIKMPVHAVESVELPPLIEQEVMASLEAPVDGVWLLQEVMNKCYQWLLPVYLWSQP